MHALSPRKIACIHLEKDSLGWTIVFTWPSIPYFFLPLIASLINLTHESHQSCALLFKNTSKVRSPCRLYLLFGEGNPGLIFCNSWFQKNHHLQPENHHKFCSAIWTTDFNFSVTLMVNIVWYGEYCVLKTNTFIQNNSYFHQSNILVFLHFILLQCFVRLHPWWIWPN